MKIKLCHANISNNIFQALLLSFIGTLRQCAMAIVYYIPLKMYSRLTYYKDLSLIMQFEEKNSIQSTLINVRHKNFCDKGFWNEKKRAYFKFNSKANTYFYLPLTSTTTTTTTMTHGHLWTMQAYCCLWAHHV